MEEIEDCRTQLGAVPRREYEKHSMHSRQKAANRLIVMQKWIDYIWFVGEFFYRREKSPGGGTALIMWCWYLDATLILLTLFHRIAGGWIFYSVIVPVLLAVPFLFCRFRYTAKRQNELFARHSGKKTGRQLWAIWAAIVGIFCLEVLLMVFSGLWSIGLR